MSAPPDRTPSLDDPALGAALGSSRDLGMLGAAPIADVIEHSAAFLAPLVGVSGTVVDLGSGGGVPGLVIAWMRPDLRVVLVDRRATRTDHLQRLVHRLRRQDQITVLTIDANALPQHLSGPVAAVVARSFGAPHVTLAAAAPILAAHGVIVVSEPPEPDPDRWAPDLLTRHGLRRDAPRPRVTVFRRVGDDDSR